MTRGGDSRRPIEQQLVAAVDRAELRHQPFDHIYMEQRARSRDATPRCSRRCRTARFYHELKHHDAVRKDGSSTRLRMYLYPELLRRLPEEQRVVWMPVAEALCSPELEQAFKRKFRTCAGGAVRQAGREDRAVSDPDPAARPAGLSHRHPQRRRQEGDHGPILPAGGRVRSATSAPSSTRATDGEAAERTTQMPFLPASGYAFPVALTKSWHSAAQRKPTRTASGCR